MTIPHSPPLPRVAPSAAVLIPTTAQAQRADGSFERTLTVAERPDIEIESGSGGIEVRQGGAGRVEVRGRVRAADWGWRRGRYSAEERIKRIEANPPIAQTGNVVRIGRIDDEESSQRRLNHLCGDSAGDVGVAVEERLGIAAHRGRHWRRRREQRLGFDCRSPLRRSGQGEHGIRWSHSGRDGGELDASSGSGSMPARVSPAPSVRTPAAAASK